MFNPAPGAPAPRAAPAPVDGLAHHGDGAGLARPAPGGHIRKLRHRERRLFANHLLRLGPGDRRMRFCGYLSDDRVRTYALAPLAPGTVLAGWFHGARLRGCGELRMDPLSLFGRRGELALSVEGPYQGRGVGTRLMRCLILLARNRGVTSLRMQCLEDNHRMRAMARTLRMHLSFEHGEASAVLLPAWPSPFTFAREVLGQGLATIDLEIARDARA